MKPPAWAAQPQAGNRNPYRMKPKLAPVVDPAVEAVELTPALCALTLETVPAPHVVMKHTYFDLPTPRINELSNNAEKRAAFEPAATHFITTFFITDPHGSIPRYPGSEDLPSETKIYNTIRRGTPKGMWPLDEWGWRKFAAHIFYLHKNGDPVRTKMLLHHTCTVEELMAAMNPPEQDPDEECLVPLPRSFAWTMKVSSLQTLNPVSLVLLHGTVPTTNSKQLADAIMSPIEWRGSNIEIFLKEGLFKFSLNKEITKDNRAAGQIAWVARADHQRVLQLLKKIYRPSKKNGFPLDRKLNAIPDLCSPCLMDHSSEEVLPAFVELRKSQKSNTLDQHVMKLEGSITSPHTDLSPNHLGLTLNTFLMSLKSTRDPMTKIYTSMDTHHSNPDITLLSCPKCHTGEAEAIKARMGILVTARVGNIGWDAWFTPKFRVEQRADFRLDPSSNVYLSTSLDMFAQLAQTDVVQAVMEVDPFYDIKLSCPIHNVVSALPSISRTTSAFPHHGNSVASSIKGNTDDFTLQDSECDDVSMSSGPYQRCSQIRPATALDGVGLWGCSLLTLMLASSLDMKAEPMAPSLPYSICCRLPKDLLLVPKLL